MMPLIDAAYVWRLLREACAGKAPFGGLHEDGLRLWRDGRWQAEGHRVTDEAAAMLDQLLPVAAGGPRYVIAQLGQSLDGRIATASGHSHYVTGQASRTHLHRLRALVDAVIVGVGTANADDPQLTVRHVAGRHPVRVLLDPSARARPELNLFHDAGPPVLHIVTRTGDAAPGAEPLVVPRNAQGRLEPGDVLAALAARGLSRVLVEGGGQTISAFIDADRVDRLHSVVAPLLIGSGRPALSLAEIATLHEARRPVCRDHAMGVDRLYDLDLRTSAAAAE